LWRLRAPAKTAISLAGAQFSDIKDIKQEMLTRLEAHFKKWLNP
jgi:hypothetical protein